MSTCEAEGETQSHSQAIKTHSSKIDKEINKWWCFRLREPLIKTTHCGTNTARTSGNHRLEPNPNPPKRERKKKNSGIIYILQNRAVLEKSVYTVKPLILDLFNNITEVTPTGLWSNQGKLLSIAGLDHFSEETTDLCNHETFVSCLIVSTYQQLLTEPLGTSSRLWDSP